MKIRMVLIAAAVLLSACAGFAQQGFSVFLYNDSYVLRQGGIGCDDGAPLPDGTPVEIRWDQNSNGFDAGDPLAPLCAQPPDCPDGPAGTVNYNTFMLNGISQGLGAGLFAVENNFTSVGTIFPASFYLVIRCPNDDTHYVSAPLTFVPGPQEVNVSQWVCIPCMPCCPCQATPSVALNFFEAQCITVCENSETTLRAGMGLAICDVKHLFGISVFPCSQNPEWGCAGQQPDGYAVIDPYAWDFDPSTGTFVNMIHGVTGGCVAVVFDAALSPDPVDVYWNPQPGDPLSLCVLVDPVGWNDACIGPFAPGNHPMLLHQPGCQTGSPCANANQPPPNQGYWPQITYFPNLNLYYWYAQAWDMHGYVCLTLENFLPVEMLSFTATPRAEAIELTWRTGSERDIASFRVARASTRESEITIGQVTAANRPGGAEYQFTDRHAEPGVLHTYRLYVTDMSGNETQVEMTAAATPGAPEGIGDYALLPNYPNPFNPTTSIAYAVKNAGRVILAVYDLNGRVVRELVNREQAPGRYAAVFDGSNLPSGIYYYRLHVNGFSATQKMVLMK